MLVALLVITSLQTTMSLQQQQGITWKSWLRAGVLGVLVGLPIDQAVANVPSPQAIELVQRALEAAGNDLRSRETEELLSASIDEWQRSSLPADELAGLLKLRSDALLSQGRPEAALRDLDQELALLNTDADPAERPRAYLSRARLRFARGEYDLALADGLASLADDDALTAIERQNPYTHELVAKSASFIGRYELAAEQFGEAERAHATVGDGLRAANAAADRALALCGAGDCERESRRVFLLKNRPTSNNPEDIPLLQELSRKDAELHLAFAARLHQSDREDAVAAWATGSLRLRAYVDDAKRRLVDDDGADLQDGVTLKQGARALAAIASGLDPQNPYVTRRAGQEFLWYEFNGKAGDVLPPPTRDGDVAARRRRIGADRANDPKLAVVDAKLTSDNFGDLRWLQANRLDWSPSLREAAVDFFRSGAAPRALDISDFPFFVLPEDGARAEVASRLGEALADFVQPQAREVASRLAAVKKRLGFARHEGPFAVRVDDQSLWPTLRERCEARVVGERRREKVGRGWFLAKSSSETWAVGGFGSQRDLERAADLAVAEAKRRLAAGEAYFVVCVTPTLDDKRRHLFPSLPVGLRAKLELDAEAEYSVSDEKSARRVATLAASLSTSEESVIIDATACVGGNAFQFASVFSRVVAIEIDDARCGMLRFNVDLLGLTNVDVLKGDCVACLPDCLRRHPGALVFVDPPWGGRGYRSRDLVDFRLANDATLVDVADLCATHAATHLLFKLPTAYDASDLAAKYRIDAHSISKKVKLVVCHLEALLDAVA
ncbi:hypothetical protein CTAYLR_001790 [Chrysophaeum taylorii]|uniref:Trimethylguanosine synthase n=1 Tax=Chrysophaeum taylorii TaxID=2483200 RepID=A0AAD7XJ94_9STRA|nr:hypothetical protein CTAYLR_001790 [Chrysophaeum taylorii]